MPIERFDCRTGHRLEPISIDEMACVATDAGDFSRIMERIYRYYLVILDGVRYQRKEETRCLQ